jgi:hypothetical protein
VTILLIGAGPNSLGEKIAEKFEDQDVIKLDKYPSDNVIVADACHPSFSSYLFHTIEKSSFTYHKFCWYY